MNERPSTELTKGQLAILDKLSAIEAELSCIVRETERARKTLDSHYPKVRKDDGTRE